METVTIGTIQFTWDPGPHLAVMRFEAETHVTGSDAEALIHALSAWIGTSGERFGLLGDGGALAGVDAEYRARWGRFLREHREQAYLAFFNMGPVIRIAAEMFRIGTGLQVKLFGDEQEARAWLRENGISA